MLKIRFTPILGFLGIAFLMLIFLVLVAFPFIAGFDKNITFPMWGGGILFVATGIWVVISRYKERWGFLKIDKNYIYYKLFFYKKMLQYPLNYAKEVKVVGRLSNIDNTRYYLMIQDKNKNNLALYFKEHRFCGRKAYHKAQKMADILNISINDPVRKKHKKSKFFLMRWIASGSEWKVVILITLILFIIFCTLVLIIR